jgi:hypothetical protein
MTFIPYSLSSDHHCHDWSVFSSITADGVNSRLQIILDELIRQAEVTKARGWGQMLLAGDLFHVRGKITPSVMNPTIATFKRICVEMGLKVAAIAGNHDLEDVFSNTLGNAMQALDEIPGFTAITQPTVLDGGVFMVPWIQDLDELRKTMAWGVGRAGDLVIHAPVNGVIKGIPDHGLEADELKMLGYDRVFAGHYHNQIDFGGGVWSIGATSHQNWSDPGTLAGWLMVDDNGVGQIESNAPKFVNVDKPIGLGEAIPDNIRGSYVRLRLQDEEEAAILLTRKACEQVGALGIVDHSSKKRPTIRGVTNVAPGLTLAAAVTSFARDHLETKLDRDRIATMALDVLTTTEASS